LDTVKIIRYYLFDSQQDKNILW